MNISMKKGTVKNQAKKEISPVFTWSVLFLIFISLLAKGLYNEELLLLYGIFASCLFLYSIIAYKRDYGVGNVLILLLAASSAVSFSLNAADPRGALLHIINVLIYLMLYTLVKLLQRDKDSSIKIYCAILASVLVLILSAMVGYSFFEERFESVLGYSNSFASILVTAIVTAIFAMSQERLQSAKTTYFFEYALLLSVISLVVTKSRGSLLTLVLLLPIILVVYRKRTQKIFYKILFYLILSIIAGTLITPLAGMSFFIAIIALPIPIIIVSNAFLGKTAGHKIPKYLILAVITLFSGYMFSRGQFFTRLSTLGIADINTIARYLFYIDGLKIFKDNLLFGTGGGGWLALYQQYQGHAYNTLEAHSFLIQYLVEGGLVGTVVFLAFIATKWLWYIQARIRQESSWYQDCAFIITLGIVAHALIDIDLSLPAFNVILFAMLAILPERRLAKGTRISSAMSFALSIIVLVSLMLFGTGRLLTNSFFNASADGLTLEEIKKYEARYAIATRIDPLNSEYYNYLAQMNLNLGRIDSDQTKISEGLANFNKSIRYLPNFVDAYIIKAQIMDGLGKEKEALESYQEACDKAPLNNNQKDFLISYYVNLGVRHRDSQYFNKALEYIGSVRKQMESVEEERKKMWVGDFLGYSNTQCYYAGLASFYLEDYSGGLEYFKNAISSSGYGALSPEMKKQIQGLIFIGETRNGLQRSYNLESDYITELEKKLESYQIK